MERKVIDTHPTLGNADERFTKMLESVLSSFELEGIQFSDEELRQMVDKMEQEIKK